MSLRNSTLCTTPVWLVPKRCPTVGDQRWGESSSLMSFTSSYHISHNTKQKSRTPESWDTCFMQTQNGITATTVFWLFPRSKGTAFNIPLAGHPSSKTQCNRCKAERVRDSFLWGRGRQTRASADTQGRNSLLLVVGIMVGRAHECFWLALKERNSFREQRP